MLHFEFGQDRLTQPHVLKVSIEASFEQFRLCVYCRSEQPAEAADLTAL